MKRSIFVKIFSGYILIVLILSGSILFVSFEKIRSYHIKSLTEDLKSIAYALQPIAKPLVISGRHSELDATAKQLGSRVKARITVIDPAGKVLADSEEDPAAMENHGTRPEIMDAFARRIGTSVRFSTTVGERMLYVAIPLDEGGRNPGAMRVSLFLKDINHFINRLMLTIVSITLLIILISLFFAWLFSRGLVRPVLLLGDAARKVAGGDFSARVQTVNRDEFRGLAENFNYMAERVQNLFGQLSSQRAELTAIISSLREALVVIDKSEKVVLCNDSFAKIAGRAVPEGTFYWEAVRETHFVELVKKVIVIKADVADEVTINDAVYLCSSSYLPAKEEVVLIFHDITELRRLEKIKKDFASNVSHELRTPLSAIKGYVETIEDTIDDKNRPYVNIIKRHTERLNSIIEDLLTLTAMEETGVLAREKVRINDIINNVAQFFAVRLAEKKLTFEIKAQSGIQEIDADTFKIEQLFINLIDNAIKYTEHGGITVTLSRHNDAVAIQIKDTGIGIPQEHLDRIFERFYVVDKSRSRKLGGTGLGLSIVKHIVLLHNGRIEVESTPGAGTTFTIVLPIS